MCVRHDHGVDRGNPAVARTTEQYGFGNHVNGQIARLLEPFVRPGMNPILWYYTPMALGAEPATVRPRLTSMTRWTISPASVAAPPELRIREARLLSHVDLVFTGGPTLYRQRRDMHPSVHCFPSGVEAAFASTTKALPPEELAHQHRPILGYYGVIDERLDLDLLAEIADLRPDWTIALIGPVTKIDERPFP